MVTVIAANRPRPLLLTLIAPSVAWAVLVLALGGAGCETSAQNPTPDAAMTGTDANGSDAGAPTCPSPTDPLNPTALIDNFEHQSSTLLPTIGGRVGGWYALGDGTSTGQLQPSGAVLPEVIPGGHCAGRYALRVTGSGFLEWGAQVLTPLYYGNNAAGTPGFLGYDGSQYQGITFFARVGDTSSVDIRFAIGDERSRPEGGICTLGGTFGTGCYDSFGTDLAPFLGTEWREFRIPFKGLGQLNIGLHSDALDTSKLYDIQFDFAPNTVFDLWVDDISFY